MDGDAFDVLARRVAALPRRRLIAAAAAALTGSALRGSRGSAGAQEECEPGLTYCPVVNNVFVPTCTDILTDGYNCGGCESVCATRECVDGACVPCEAQGLSECPGGSLPYCADLLADPSQCGACANRCDSGNCVDGQCVNLDCPAGLVDCGGRCTDLAVDQGNCGRCAFSCCGGIGAPCGPCQSGVCITCPPSTVNVLEGDSWRCADLATDPLHCGARDSPCASGVCEVGVCVDPTASGDAVASDAAPETSDVPTAEAAPEASPGAADVPPTSAPEPDVVAETAPEAPSPNLSDASIDAPVVSAGTATDGAVAPDGPILRAAFILKRATAAMHAQAVDAFDDGAFGDYLGLRAELARIAEQDGAHAASLEGALGETVVADGPPSRTATMDADVAAFLARARRAESLASSALLGLAAQASDPTLAVLLAGIAAVDGHHAGYLNAWSGANAAAAAFPEAVDPADALALASGDAEGGG